MTTKILCIAGPTASGKSARAVEIALEGFVNPTSDVGFTKPNMGEIISVDSRQVYRGLDIGTEKITREEIRQLAERGVPHHLIDIREVNEVYSAGDFVADASRLIQDISERGKLPILVGGTHFYFDALLNGLPVGVDANPELREELEKLPTEELYARVRSADARRSAEIDPMNRRRLIRALEIIESKGKVPVRPSLGSGSRYCSKWIVIDPPKEELRERINARLKQALGRGLVEEVRSISEHFGDTRLNELGLEYKIVGEFLRGERTEKSLLPTLSAKLWQYARQQKAWLRKLNVNEPIVVTSSRQGRS